ncbi:MAG: hypothetical protein ACE363_00225 [Alphaproteobacteria bacterium]
MDRIKLFSAFAALAAALAAPTSIAFEVGTSSTESVSYENCKDGEGLRCFKLELYVEQDRGGSTGKVAAGLDRVNIHTDAHCDAKTISGASSYGVPEFTLDMKSGPTTLLKNITLPIGCTFGFHARETMLWPAKDKIHTFTLDASNVSGDMCLVFNTWTGHTWSC